MCDSPFTRIGLLLTVLPAFALVSGADRAQAEAADPVSDSSADLPWLEREQLSGSWGGFRDRMASHGFTIDADLTIEAGRVLTGGERQRWRTRHLAELGVTWDPAPLTGWEGVRVYALLQTARDRDSTADVGSVQGVSAFEAGRSVDQIGEIWLEQILGDDQWVVRLGKIDVSEMFGSGTHGETFFADIFTGFPTTLGQPVYPEQAFGGTLGAMLPARFDVMAGLFDGAAQEGFRTGTRGPSTLFGSPADLFMIAEVGWSFGDEEARAVGNGRLALGAWRHTGTFDRFEGGTRSGVNGLHATMDYHLPIFGDRVDTLALFGRFGYTSDSVSEVAYHAALGAAWSGLIPGREEDIAQLGLGYARLTKFTEEADLNGRTEWLTELSYRMEVTPAIAVTPAVIGVFSPEGGGRRAMMGAVRLELAF